MRLISLSFLCGTLLIHFNHRLPSLLWISLIFSVVIFSKLFFKNQGKTLNASLIVSVSMIAGLFTATSVSQYQLNQRLPTEYEGKDVLLQGRIVDIPNEKNDGIRFRLKIDKAFLVDDLETAINIGGITRLGWFQNVEKVSAGESWQFRARLKRPSGFYNPGGFDYEKWLFTERITSTGYIRARKEEWRGQSKRLADSPWWSVNRLRQNIHKLIQEKVADRNSAAVLSAMVVAVRSKLDDDQWRLLQNTGTSHLIAISGLHIAVVAGFAFLPIMLFWRVFPWLNERVPVRVAGAIVGVLFATAYAMLAGFTLPTQRALLMVVIAMFGVLSKRNYHASNILAGALLAVLILDPLAAMTASFWLSFLAVSLILVFLKRQMGQPRYQLIKLQMFLSLAMLPLTLLFFNSASFTSPVANLLAIPWVSFIVVPVSLLAVILMPISTLISDGLFKIAAFSIDILFKFLGYLRDSSLAEIHLAQIPNYYLIMAFLGLLYLLLPKGFPARWLGLLAFLPAVLFNVSKPNQNEFSYILLDVGQGMASVIQTKHHVLIYDVGTRISETYDIGKLVVLPYLKSKGIVSVDKMMLSHEDIDHRGGADTVLKEITANVIQSSELNILPEHNIKPCESGERWRWDGVDFEILSPPKNLEESDNNRSCVLRVSNDYHSLLLTGDIEKKVEISLLSQNSKKLDADVLSVPHHGSKTSSSEDFIKAVSPRIGLITAGYRNRFGHPKQQIVQRYNENNVRLFNTIEDGAIELKFSDSEQAIESNSYRTMKGGFWSR